MSASNQNRAVARSTRKLLFAVLGMFGFAFAMVPFYDVFCEVTGLNGKTNSSAAQLDESMQVDESRTVTVAFIANLNQSMPWKFSPEVSKMKVHPGQIYITQYYAENQTDRSIVAHAVPSVAPGQAARHFQKVECFCFTEQLFEGGEGRWMPVKFMVDPTLDEDIEEVTLSYTFFDTGARTAAAPKGLETLGEKPAGAM